MLPSVLGTFALGLLGALQAEQTPHAILPSACSIAGIVLDATGLPLSGAIVGSAPGRSVNVTDRAGAFCLDRAHHDARILTAALPGFRPARVILEPGGRTDDVRVVLTPEFAEDVDVAAAGQPVGIRARLAQVGIAMEGAYISDWSRVRPRGTERRVIGRGLLDTSVTVDLDRLVGLRGTTAHVQHLWKGGGNGSAYLSDAQGFSNIDADDFRRVGELWLEQRLTSDRLRVKAGRVDANTEFAAVDAAGDFLNSSMGFSPTIAALPTYPDPALSLNVFVDPHPRLHAGVAVYRAPGGDPFTIAEIGGSWELGREGLAGRASLGAWRLPVERGDATRSQSGSYGVLEQTLWRRAARSEAPRSLTAFVQIGRSTSATCSTDRHLGGGIVLRSPFARRPLDSVGFGFTRVRLGDESENAGGTELAIGPFVRVQVNEWIAITPDAQHVSRPGGSTAAGASFVGTVRVTVAF